VSNDNPFSDNQLNTTLMLQHRDRARHRPQPRRAILARSDRHSPQAPAVAVRRGLSG